VGYSLRHYVVVSGFAFADGNFKNGLHGLEKNAVDDNTIEPALS
jgi:hypothetical protein